LRTRFGSAVRQFVQPTQEIPMSHPNFFVPLKIAPLALAVACASSLSISNAQTPLSSTIKPSNESAITLEPPTGQELRTHTFDAEGNKLPEAPGNFRRFGQAQVGEQAEVHTLTLRFAETQKITGLKSTSDFQIEQGGSCAEGNVYEAKTSCTVLIRFTPKGPGNRIGRLSVSSSLSPTPMAFGLGGYGYSPVISFIPSTISTLTGTYPSSVGLLNGAQNLTIDGGDTMWVADSGNGLLRQKDASGNFISLASGYPGLVGVAVDTFGQAYFDVPSTGEMFEIYDYGPIIQVSGTGTTSCPASAPCNLGGEALSTPGEMSIDPYNHLFFVDGHSGAAFSTVQPPPANLIFLYDPFPFQTSPSSAMAVDSGDNMYSFWANGSVCEIVQQSLYNAENSNVSFNKIAGGHTCGFAGDGGLAGSAEIGAKIGQIAFDAAGNLYFTDTNNQRVRRIEYNTGVIRTIAGNGVAGYAGDGGGATFATLHNPTGLGVDSSGNVYIISNSATSGAAQVIRKVGPTGYLNFGSQAKGTTGSPVQLVVTNTGNSAMILSSYTFIGGAAADFKLVTSSTTCDLAAGGTLSAGQSCYVGIAFAPSAAGGRSATLRFASNTIAGTNDVNLLGTGTLPVPTMAITSPASGSTFHSGTAVTFTVSVTASPLPTGTVQFKVDGANFGSPVTLSSTGTASVSVTGLTQTGHSLSATYSGSTVYAPAGPVSVSIVVAAVKAASVVSLSASASASCATSQFLVSVKSSSSSIPTGQVILYDGNRSLLSASLVNGKVTLAPTSLGMGRHQLSVRYQGDSTHLPAISSTLSEMRLATTPCSPGRIIHRASSNPQP
jgi:hypothetical protein